MTPKPEQRSGSGLVAGIGVVAGRPLPDDADHAAARPAPAPNTDPGPSGPWDD